MVTKRKEWTDLAEVLLPIISDNSSSNKNRLGCFGQWWCCLMLWKNHPQPTVTTSKFIDATHATTIAQACIYMWNQNSKESEVVHKLVVLPRDMRLVWKSVSLANLLRPHADRYACQPQPPCRGTLNGFPWRQTSPSPWLPQAGYLRLVESLRRKHMWPQVTVMALHGHIYPLRIPSRNMIWHYTAMPNDDSKNDRIMIYSW